MAELADKLANAMFMLEERQVLALVQERLQAGVAPLEIVGSLQEGMAEVGSRFESGEYFLSELVMAGEVMKKAMAELEPHLAGANREYRGNVVIGTVKGDIHDLGKNVVVMLLKGTGYHVIDLGVDVHPDRFVEAVKEHQAPLVGMSVLLTACQDALKVTIEKIRAAGLDVTVIIGGNYVDETVKEYVGADYFATNASDALKIAEKVFAA